jgi:hypothetical protein
MDKEINHILRLEFRAFSFYIGTYHNKEHKEAKKLKISHNYNKPR